MSEHRSDHKGLFVTGTDTGVGKTLVAAGLVRLARKRGLRCVAVKPVETGCPVKSGVLYPEDGAFLARASQDDITLDECAPIRFSVPASPARSAAMEGTGVHVSDLVEHVLAVADRVDLVVVEGAGGLMVPIEQDLMMIDLAQRLEFPVVLVARGRLGTINHTMLSVEALRHRGIALAAIVISFTDSDAGPEEEYTAGDIARLVRPVPVVALPHLTPEVAGDPDRISSAMEKTWSAELVTGLLL